MACSSCQASTRLMAIASTSSRIPSRPRSGRTARGPQRAGATVAGLTETMAGRDVRKTVEKIRHGDGGALRALALGCLAALRGQRPHRDRQQCRRTLPAHNRSGQKELLFAGSDAGGERAAAIYSLIGTAKLNGLDPGGLSPKRAVPHRRPSDQPHRGAPALEHHNRTLPSNPNTPRNKFRSLSTRPCPVTFGRLPRAQPS